MEWKDIPGFAGAYKISEYGDVVSCARTISSKRHASGFKRLAERRMRTSSHKGYKSLHLVTREGVCVRGKIHQLVALAFLGPRPDWAECVRHLDDNPANNHYTNLAYGTIADNVADSIRNGTFTRADKNGQALLTNRQVADIKRLILAGARTGDLAKEFGVSAQTISCLKTGRNWASVGPVIPIEDRSIFAHIGGVAVPLKKYARRLGLCYESVRFRVRRKGETVSEAARGLLSRRAA